MAQPHQGSWVANEKGLCIAFAPWRGCCAFVLNVGNIRVSQEMDVLGCWYRTESYRGINPCTDGYSVWSTFRRPSCYLLGTWNSTFLLRFNHQTSVSVNKLEWLVVKKQKNGHHALVASRVACPSRVFVSVRTPARGCEFILGATGRSVSCDLIALKLGCFCAQAAGSIADASAYWSDDRAW
jgi:hypothetical protein